MSFTSSVVQLTPSWPGFSKIKNLVIFGDSYSSVLAMHSPGKPILPTPSQPLGVPFPAEIGGVWGEPDLPNWVGYLISQYRPGPKYKPGRNDQDEDYLKHPLLVYDYALGGNTLTGMKQQLALFMKDAGAKPDWAPWTSEDTLFVTWIGINDCAYSKIHDKDIGWLLEYQESLYENGARNFLLIDVPPIERSPAVRPQQTEFAKETYHDWNTRLAAGLAQFSTARPDATVLLWSSWETFHKILDEPEKHGFSPENIKKRYGEVWFDHLHPTSAVHNHIAKYLTDFLQTV